MSRPYRVVTRDVDYGTKGVEVVYDVLGPNGEVFRGLRYGVDASTRAKSLNAAYAAGQSAAQEHDINGDAIMEARAYIKQHLGVSRDFFDDVIHDAVACALLARDETARLRAALEKYGQHARSCPALSFTDEGCSCGWDEALAATPATVEQTGKPGVRQDFEPRGSQAEKAGVSTEPVLKEPAAIGAYSAAHPSNAEDRALIERFRGLLGDSEAWEQLYFASTNDEVIRLLALAEKGLRP